MKGSPVDSEIISVHPYTRPGIRLWLPALMIMLIALCGWLVTPRLRIMGFITFLFLVYVAISSLVAVCEIAVVADGLVIDRLLLPARFVPWDAVNRVIIYTRPGGEVDTHVEIASLSVYEGLSVLNRLPGLVYGQGFRQTIIITPDTIEDYDTLLVALEEHCHVFWQKP